jgi:hypothetical protein
MAGHPAEAGVELRRPNIVMAGLVPAIHDFLCCQNVDARVKPGQDGKKK